MAKISLDKTMQDIVSLNNQIAGLKMLLQHKKDQMAKYFTVTGQKSIANEECTVFVQERTKIEYDVDAILKSLGKEEAKRFVDWHYTIPDFKRFALFLKSKGIEPKDVRPFLFVTKEVNQDKLTKLYEQGDITLEDLEGCYTASVTKSVALRMKNIDKEVPISNGNKK